MSDDPTRDAAAAVIGAALPALITWAATRLTTGHDDPEADLRALLDSAEALAIAREKAKFGVVLP